MTRSVVCVVLFCVGSVLCLHSSEGCATPAPPPPANCEYCASDKCTNLMYLRQVAWIPAAPGGVPIPGVPKDYVILEVNGEVETPVFNGIDGLALPPTNPPATTFENYILPTNVCYSNIENQSESYIVKACTGGETCTDSSDAPSRTFSYRLELLSGSNINGASLGGVQKATCSKTPK